MVKIVSNLHSYDLTNRDKLGVSTYRLSNTNNCLKLYLNVWCVALPGDDVSENDISRTAIIL